MKRYLSFIFILSILLGSVGHVFLSRLCIKWQKQAFRTYTIQNHSGRWRQLSVYPYTLYKNNSHLRWLENNKEVEINGQRYDIVGHSLKNGVTTFLILEDTQENTLLSFGLKQAKQQNKALRYIQLLLGMHYLTPSPLLSSNKSLLQGLPYSFKDTRIVYSIGFRNSLTKPPASLS